MQIGIVGLGRMGSNIARRLLAAGHSCIAFDLDLARVDEIAAAGAQAARDLSGLVAALSAPRVLWIMLPAGSATETAIHTLSDLLSPGDIIVDGGNTFYEDDLRRAALLAESGIG